MFRRRADGPVEYLRTDHEPLARVPKEFIEVRRAAFESRRFWPHALQRHWHVVEARRNRRLVGYVLLFGHPEDGDADLNDLAVHPDHQRLGIGHTLCVNAIEWMTELGYDVITGLPMSSGSHTIFARVGFRPGVPGAIGYALELRPR